MQRPFILLTLSSLLLGACGGGKNDSESETADTTGATSTATATTTASDGTDSTIGMSSSPTTSGDGGTGTSNPTTEDGGSATTADAESTAGGATTTSAGETDGDPDLMPLCENWCGKNTECNPDGDPDGCVASCVEELGGDDPVCAAATKDMLACMLEMTCAQFVAFIDEDEPGPCGPQANAVEEVCTGQVCTAGVGGNMEGTECAYSVDCPDQPLQEVQCDTETCTCILGGKLVGTCDAEDVCTDAGNLPMKAEGCCGF